MTSKTRIWLRSAAAAIINSTAGAISGAISGALVKPEVFNLGAGLADLAQLAAYSAIVGCVLGLTNFLKASPLPGHNGGPQP